MTMLQARIKNWFGWGTRLPDSQTVTAAGTITLAADQTFVTVASASAVDTATTQVFVNGDKIRPGRQFCIYNANASDAITLKGTAVASAAENYISGSDISLTAGLTVTLLQLNNGAWTLVS
jgi:hypothetical protein